MNEDKIAAIVVAAAFLPLVIWALKVWWKMLVDAWHW